MTSLPLSRFGLGGAPIGNLLQAVADEDAFGVLEAAWDGGVRYFDTAPHYGLGLSEQRLRSYLADRPREEYVVSTKVGRLLEPLAPPHGPDSEHFEVPATHRRRWDFSTDGVRRSLYESLERLGLDRVDIVLLHDPDDHLDEAIGTAYPALAALRDEGVVRAIGAGMNTRAPLARLVRECDLDVVMLAGRYTLLEQDALDDVLPACLRHGTGVLAAGVFNSGLLAEDRPPDTATYNYHQAPPELLSRARELAALCAEFGVTLPQAAVQFVLAHPLVRSAVLGARTAGQVRRNVTLANQEADPMLWAELKRHRFIRDDAPTPAS